MRPGRMVRPGARPRAIAFNSAFFSVPSGQRRLIRPTMAGMRHTHRNWLLVLAVIGGAALCGPTAAAAAACENGVDNADTCAAQQSANAQSHRRSGPHVFAYGRLGSGFVFAERTHRAPAIGLGFRAELDTFAVDVSVLNFALAFDPYERSPDITVGSRLKLSARSEEHTSELQSRL